MNGDFRRGWPMSRQLWGGFTKEHQFLDLVANHNVAVVIVEGGAAQVTSATPKALADELTRLAVLSG